MSMIIVTNYKNIIIYNKTVIWSAGLVVNARDKCHPHGTETSSVTHNS